jgi:hypothetical protein
LFFLADFQPELDQEDSRLDDVTLEFGTVLHEFLVLVLGAKIHDVFHAGPVVPAPVEDDYFAGSREVLHVALRVELGFLAVGRGRQRHQTEDARADPLHDRLDGPALAGGVAPLEHHDHPQPLVHDPLLQPAQLDLQLVQFLLVFLAFQLRACFCEMFGHRFAPGNGRQRPARLGLVVISG